MRLKLVNLDKPIMPKGARFLTAYCDLSYRIWIFSSQFGWRTIVTSKTLATCDFNVRLIQIITIVGIRVPNFNALFWKYSDLMELIDTYIAIRCNIKRWCLDSLRCQIQLNGYFCVNNVVSSVSHEIVIILKIDNGQYTVLSRLLTSDFMLCP